MAAAAAAAGAEPAAGHHAAANDDDDSTLTLRLVAMGVIALVSLCGCGLPALVYRWHHRKVGGASPTTGRAAAERLPVFSILKVCWGGFVQRR